MKELTKDLLKVKIYTTTEEMGLAAAEDVAQRIMALLSEKPEINMIFAAAPSQSAFLSSLIKDKRIEWGENQCLPYGRVYRHSENAITEFR